jgi:TetR/AcrR family transcriptional repressor of nem operon
MKKLIGKKERNIEASRKEILHFAFFEIFMHGFQGVSVDDIVKKTSMTKGAFYHNFPTKLDLGYALVDDVIKPMILERWIEPLAGYDNPLEGILIQMQRLMGDVEPKILECGCPLNNLVQEMTPLDSGFQKRLQAALTLWVDEMDKHLKRGQANGFIKRDIDTRYVAYFVVMAHEGFYGMMKGLGPQDAFPALYDTIQVFFDAISETKNLRINKSML